ncbi:MAG: hypothetical protein L3J11_09880 [Draconibacterium sp.]|nr:hypothetical protein [Draconibacterium sp.]
MVKHLTKRAVREAQKSWGEGVLKIGESFSKNEDYKSVTEEFVNQHYGYKEGIVLFKPTIASIEQFRDTFEKAISYFISGNPKFPEDLGFALRPWKTIKFRNAGIIHIKNHAVAMGNYFFTDFNGDETKVEYTFAYFLSENGSLKINVHHSSLPFKANKKK